MSCLLFCYNPPVKITVLNGNPDASNTGFDLYLRSLAQSLESSGHEVIGFQLRDLDIRYCLGCFGCWVKQPGECLVVDDSVRIRREVITSRLLIYASPVIMGFTSALMKKVQDKLIPLLLPYIGMYQGEQHHLPRYDAYPLMGLLLQPEADTDEEDLSIIRDIYDRIAINFHSKVVYSGLVTDSVEEAVNEINRL